MADGPSLPTRFPCWVQAVYSWGGESKKDLGFMEGDLIECLNAGDGSWWMGRLRRDRRAVGLFPSNFVKVLDADFSPVPRMSSSTSRGGSGSQSPAPAAPIPQKAKFRGPYTAMAVAPPGAKSTPSPAASITKKTTHMPYSSMKKPTAAPIPKPISTRPPPPSIPAPIARGYSPNPSSDPNTPTRTPSWAPSYAPSRAGSRAASRAASPAPQDWSTQYASPLGQPPSQAISPLPEPSHWNALPQEPPRPHSRAASPLPSMHRAASPLPSRHRAHSPLPPHHRSRSPLPPQHYDTYRQPSPTPSARSYRSLYPAQGDHDYREDTVSHHEDEHEVPYIDEDYFAHGMDTQPHFDHSSGASPQSSPPPPPPAHRVAYTRQTTPQPTHDEDDDGPDTVRKASRSPAPSERSRAMTPSPLRDAMNDVMSSLEGMSVSRKNSQIDTSDEYRTVPAEPVDIWSAEAFDELYTAKAARRPRPKTANSFRSVAHEEVEEQRRLPQDGPFPIWSASKPQSTVDNFVDRMEKRRSQLEPDNGHDFTADDITSSPPAAPSMFRVPGRSRSKASKHASSRSESHAVSSEDVENGLRHRKSAYELGKDRLKRTFSTKSTVTIASSAAQSTSTNTSNSTAMTSQSLMSGYSAGGFSATSAGSLARRTPQRSGSIKERARSIFEGRPGTAMSGVSYHPSHASGTGSAGQAMCQPIDPLSMTGFAPNGVKKKKSFVRSLLDKAKTSTASARSAVSTGEPSRPSSPHSMFGSGPVSGGISSQDAAKEMGLGGGGNDWMQMRRDVNRSNSISRNERNERVERCQMMDIPVLAPVDILQDAEGDESADGYAVNQPIDFTASNLAQVDKNTRFISNLPGTINATSLAQGYLCRPYRSEVQRLRAIFTWVSERVAWEEDYEGEVDTRRIIQSRRACSKEVAVLVAEMCDSLGIHAEVVHGYLKTPGDTHDLHNAASKPNHWWNAVIVEGEWRMIDCSLASPSNPRRILYSSAGNQTAESFWFLTRPMEACYSHVPSIPEEQHIVPPMPTEVLLALPVAGPGHFKGNIRMWDFDTSLTHLDGLEMAHIQFLVPESVECTAEVEARAFAQDADGDFFENGDIVRKPTLTQAEFVTVNGSSTALKRYTVRALVPNTSSAATLKIYAGRRGLQHSIHNNPHPFALALPLTHQGLNPDYEFLTRHPTPHALRHELYVVSPLCKKLVCNNTIVFSIRQHPASTSSYQAAVDAGNGSGSNTRPTSALSTRPTLNRPISSLSIASISVTGSSYSDPSTSNALDPNATLDAQGLQLSKPAKLAIQTPGGKIIRLTRKLEPAAGTRGRGGRLAMEKESEEGCVRLGSMWETVVKVGEKGVWRGLVLADRSARWCVWGEWCCV